MAVIQFVLHLDSIDRLERLQVLQMDPSKEATQYLSDHKVLELFKEIAALLAFHQPEDPNAFIIDYLKKDRKQYFNEQDFGAMFGLIDVTGKGVISREQYLHGLRSLEPGVQNSKALSLSSEVAIDRISFVNMMCALIAHTVSPLTSL